MSGTTPVVQPPGVSPPPPGVTPNFVDPVVRSAGIVELICIFIALSTVTLVLRLYTKARIIKIWGLDDLSVTLGWICVVVVMGRFWGGLGRMGAGAHIWNMTQTQFPVYFKATAATIIIATPALALPKIAILLFYLRLNPTRSFRYSTLATVSYLISFTLVTIFQCSPPKKFWAPLVPGKCINANAFYLAVPIINMIIDVLTFVLPIPMVVNLHVNMRTKLVLAAIFAASGCTVVLSAVRVWAIQDIQDTTDITWNAYTSDLVMIVELNMTVVCACVMVLRPFCRRHLPFLLRARRSRPTDDKTPVADAALKFDGPSDPRSKSSYAAKVSGGSRGTKKSSTKRSLWPGLSTTLVKEDDDDMESLSQELKTIAPHVHSGRGAHGNYGAVDTRRWQNQENGQSWETVGGPMTQARDPYPALGEGDVERGIVKTVSLDVR